jgi:hypothetical protein
MNDIAPEITPNMTIMQFVREDRGRLAGQPRGIVIASVVDGKISIGWSYTKHTAGDRFDKERGIDIATARLSTGTNSKVPNLVGKVVTKMRDRAKAYFKIDSFNEFSVVD